MRIIEASQIVETIRKLCIEANCRLPEDVTGCIYKMLSEETWEPAKMQMGLILENARLADGRMEPICQDDGVVCVFLEIGQNLIINGDIHDAVNEGVRCGYKEGYFRNSVAHPLSRENTGDNTPAMIYTELVPGEMIKITVAPKGFGAENMSKLKMMLPSDGEDSITEFVLSVIKEAGANPCPPIIVGVGIGGTFDKCALLAKKALFRPIDQPNPDSRIQALEKRLLDEINKTGIGPQGLGGKTTALHVAIETMHTHIAGLPCAVNINCHASRHATEVI